jgi:plastocyanin
MALLAMPSNARAERDIVIEQSGGIPSVVQVTLGERVTFINRTGQTVHIEFQDAPGRHAIVQVPGASTIRASFRRTGTHPYVVHFPDSGQPALQGMVEVLHIHDSREPAEPGACVEQPIAGVCLEQ